MGDNTYLIIGGVGMFLIGMEVMTAALRDAAGRNLRGWLTRFTTTPLHGVATGAVSTAIIQSSSATTVMTVGFVGAGLLSMGQALGIIYGANIGTTATGWLVSILGFKLDLSSIAMVALLPASLADLLARGNLARLGRVIAGLCLLLIGLELMQEGMKDVTSFMTPEILPDTNLLGLLALVGIGTLVTILVQSSSAAMALALVMLESNAISLIQAAAIVIGMNIGTTFTALLASLGGSRPMRQTAVANLAFNLATSAIAFPILIVFAGAMTNLAAATDSLTALLVFHTGFNILGTALFLPFTRQFSGAIAKLVPDKMPERLISLDRALLDDPGSAVLSAQTATTTVAERLFQALGEALNHPPDYRKISALEGCAEALEELEEFLSDIRLPDDSPPDEAAFSAVLHQVDHLSRLLARANQTARIQTLLEDTRLRRPALVVGATLRRQTTDGFPKSGQRRLARLHRLVKHRKEKHRRGLLLGEHAGLFTLHQVFSHTDAMRWLDRMLHHAERVSFYNSSGRDLLTQPTEFNKL